MRTMKTMLAGICVVALAVSMVSNAGAASSRKKKGKGGGDKAAAKAKKNALQMRKKAYALAAEAKAAIAKARTLRAKLDAANEAAKDPSNPSKLYWSIHWDVRYIGFRIKYAVGFNSSATKRLATAEKELSAGDYRRAEASFKQAGTYFRIAAYPGAGSAIKRALAGLKKLKKLKKGKKGKK